MGGVFDPPHNGHIEAVKYVLKEHIVDRVIVIPCLRQPLKDTVTTPYSIRMEMTEKAFENIDNVSVSDIESHLPEPSYTVNTLEHLKRKMPDDKLFLIIGYDEAEIIDKWHEPMKLRDYAGFIIIRRDTKHHNIDKDYFNDAIFMCNEIVPISSTEIRNAVKCGDIGKLTVPAVRNIIRKKGLYS